ncbi:hypothetical protein BWZ43_16345 [Heyndrickxia oleronia]|jgi:hypothetical protein|uniref:Uncharacterized protein n=1 Tax=Heyndrickxia oleronia TaxID=38875 RepID=A0A8E2LEM0_9BACI|nr:hypothetical protein BWZ43_16345 [Heyndrickxia oleronia]
MNSTKEDKILVIHILVAKVIINLIKFLSKEKTYYFNRTWLGMYLCCGKYLYFNREKGGNALGV